ncbi:MAG: hypothetical protein ACFCUQ_08555 [Kiloniellales bacterium]
MSAGAKPRRANGEGFSAWWWLAMPIAVALVLAVVDLSWPEFYKVYIGSELGLLEGSHVLIPLAAMVIAIRILMLRETRRHPWLVAWVALGAAACLYIAGEEASWGQHYVGWSTPERWQEINDQQETNLHNVSSWLDQKPRLVLELGVIIGGIIIPIAALFRPALRQVRFAVILPPLLCLPVAVLAEVIRLTERVPGLIGTQPILYERPSELQELYFYLFILFYLIVLRQRLTAASQERMAARAAPEFSAD